MSIDKIKEIDNQIKLLQIERDEIIKYIKPTDEEINVFYEFSKKELIKNINTSDSICDIFIDLKSEYPDKLIRLEVYSFSKSDIINLFFDFLNGDEEMIDLKYSKFLLDSDIIPINDNSIYSLSLQIFYTSKICELINTLELDVNKIDINSFIKNYHSMKEKIEYIESNKDLLRLIDLSILQ